MAADLVKGKEKVAWVSFWRDLQKKKVDVMAMGRRAGNTGALKGRLVDLRTHFQEHLGKKMTSTLMSLILALNRKEQSQ
jgi:hypothetical protein